MEKNIEVSLLFDFYGELLKPSGKKAIDLYYNEDLSLAEVADETGITRQGVRDSIKRSEQQLFEFEEKLGLFKQFSKLEQGLDEISALALEIKRTFTGYTNHRACGCYHRKIRLAERLKEFSWHLKDLQISLAMRSKTEKQRQAF